MGKLLIGFLFTFLNFNLTGGSVVIGLLPDFVGYYFITKGLEELSEESHYFAISRPIAKVMIVITAVVYALNAFGLYSLLGILATLIDIVLMLVLFIVTYRIVQGVEEMEKLRKQSLVADIMRQAWWIRTICAVAAYAAVFVPQIQLITVIAVIISSVWFLLVFLQSSRLYDGKQ